MIATRFILWEYLVSNLLVKWRVNFFLSFIAGLEQITNLRRIVTFLSSSYFCSFVSAHQFVSFKPFYFLSFPILSYFHHSFFLSVCPLFCSSIVSFLLNFSVVVFFSCLYFFASQTIVTAFFFDSWCERSLTISL